MARLTRKLQKIFGSSLAPTGNVAVFGSLAAGSPAYSADPDSIQSLSNFLQGLNGGVVGNNSPTIQDFNALILLITRQISYVLQQGIPEWITGDTYYVGGLVTDGAGNVYVSQADANTGHALSNTSYWLPLQTTMTGPNLCRAWAVFDGVNASGGNSRIINSWNVDHVVKNAAGNYTAVFGAALPSKNYTLTGSCGTEDGSYYGGGDDGVVVGTITGVTSAIRSTTQCQFFTVKPATGTPTASGCTSVLFFGS